MAHEPIYINPPRPLTLEEAGVLDRLLSADFQGREALLGQAKSVCVIEECRSCRSIKLTVENVPENIAVVSNRIPVEAETIDADGVTIHVLLHVVHGWIDEIEVFREDPKNVMEWPNPASLVLLT